MDGEPVYPPDDLERYLIRLTRLNVEELLAIDAAYRAAELQRTIDPGGVLRAAGNGERDGSAKSASRPVTASATPGSGSRVERAIRSSCSARSGASRWPPWMGPWRSCFAIG
jgi:hypothetical protein